ncbi:MAG: Brp/Blh family beta-carotene 15,15'-dioxygenase [Pseudomonadota bacterium]|uniref:Probable beta-carotene 15,15'-dioxygenase n=2 Tax=Vibrio campbellii TaxID=680 RepID=E0WCM4_9VIBR|nr:MULTISPECIES: Brp/Blh family beta-carotene 15,15'-dioxygenase [Vibrio]ABU71130.1 hypothetical protein VIBHAR_02165 [Vibrio campbellii ATCC BAA-1116]ADC84427.1 beta-carotene dioxygenase [Vibrio campbellii]AGU96068.1 putative 15,15'-beta-carotene dioxygenase Blh [Vibrio campbellii ATCC BAA-1116]MBT0123821.1 beta-carotene 15,15'-dioxygenase, Brp/Blh family [Vibrio campbellii]MBT0138790.1 beta-carotene 15,15'-dioxygenase, Brp/Blh family [Vibrio campbellii]
MISYEKPSATQLGAVYSGAAILSGLFSEFTFSDLTPLIAILVFGLPHGALDIIMLNKLTVEKRSSQVTLATACIAYFLVVVCCLFTWLWLPTFCLCLFLALAAYHFGCDWTNIAPKRWRLVGIIVLAMPALFQPNSVAMYFSALGVPHDATRNIVLTMSILGLLSLTALLIDFRQISLELITWLVVLSLTSYALPVLYYFCVYFCGLHGPLHTLDIKRRYRLSWYFLVKASAIPMVSAAIIAVCFFFFLPNDFDGNKWLPTVFVVLFALTVPHLILTIVHDHREKSASD